MDGFVDGVELGTTMGAYLLVLTLGQLEGTAVGVTLGADKGTAVGPS